MASNPGKSYPKGGQIGTRKHGIGKSEGEILLQTGETPQLPGGVSPDRKFTKNYVPGDPESMGPSPVPSSMYDR